MSARSPVHPANLGTEELLAQCRLTPGRKSGPGGQHRNKVQTAVELLHQPTGVRAAASERRSQVANRRVAVFRLRVKLALEVRYRRDPAKPPSDLWQSRCRGGRIAISPSHSDFPALLAEVLDVLACFGMDIAQAAAILGCSRSQLIKFCKLEMSVFAKINQQRRELGLHVFH